jgi:GT2 family glycosyltransferase/glycosyltransferase involved in cell wall biosynthesis
MLGAYVLGWAVAEPDVGNCLIRVVDAEGNTLARGRASRHRADLATLGLGRTTMSFRIAIPAGTARQLLRVFANDEEIPGSPLLVGPGCFDGDGVILADTISGWVSERVQGFEPPLITVLDQHGAKIGETRSTLDQQNTDRSAMTARYKVVLFDRCFGAGELRLSILANGVKFAESSCNLRLQGNLESVTAEHCNGWLLSPDVPHRALTVDVFRDGEAVASAATDLTREDVRGVVPDCETPGFSIRLPKPETHPLEATTISLRLPGSDVELFEGPYVLGSRAAAVAAAQRAARLAFYGLGGVGAAERAVLQRALGDYMKAARAGNGFTATAQPDPVVPYGPKPRISIIIPVYRGIEVTRDCLNSVLQHRNPATDQVVIINDCSPEPLMAPMLSQLNGVANVFLLTNGDNLGFVQSVNRGLRFATGSDVLLLNSDTVMFAGGLNELCRVAYAAAEIGTVTAMSNNATIFSYPHVSLRQTALDDMTWPELAAAALAQNAGLTVEVPTGHGFCMFIKGEVLRRIGLLDEGFGRGYGEENDLCARAADLGYLHVAAAGVLVEHRESTSFTTEKDHLLAANLPRLNAMYPEYTPVIMEFERTDGLRKARWALDRLRLRKAAAAGQQFVLLVTNALDGGTKKAVADIEEFAGYGGAAKLVLRCRDDGFLQLAGDTPILLATFAPREMDELFETLGAVAPTHLIVHQLLGFPAAFIERLGDWASARHSIYYQHDFYSICPRVTMIDAVGRFCGLADTETCVRCLAIDGAHETSKLSNLTPEAHREMFGELLRGFRHVVAPSGSAAGFLKQAFPHAPVQVVPHPESSAGIATAPRGGPDEEVIMIGAIGPHKGSRRLLEIAQRARLTHPDLNFRVIGFTDIDKQLLAVGNVTITGRYKPDELPHLVAQARGRLAIFLHAWPETYSYTLSEAAGFGFIPLVPDIGAPAERVREAGYGVVFPFPINAEQVLDIIADARAGRIPTHTPGATPSRLFPGPQEIEMTRRILHGNAAAAPEKPARAAKRRTAGALTAAD